MKPIGIAEKEQPKVSVIVPLYNQKRYLETCIRSITNQSYKNLEIIIVNDGSTDDSLARANKLAEGDRRIIVCDKQNEGTSFARRDGYLLSTGDYITFVDNDDLLPVRSIEIMVHLIEEKNLDMVLGGISRKLGFIVKKQEYGTFPLNEIVKSPRLFNDYYLGFFKNSIFPISIWGRLYRKSIIDEAYKATELFSDEMPCMAGDEYFNLKIFPYLKSVYRTDEIVYCYRLGGTVDHFNRFFPETFVLSDKRLELLDHYGYEKGYRPLFVEYVNMVYYHAMQLLQYKQGDKDDVIAFFKDELKRRSIAPRLIDYFEKNKTDDQGIILFMNHDYEAMHLYAYKLMRELCGGLRYKAVRLALNIIEKLA